VIGAALLADPGVLTLDSVSVTGNTSGGGG